MKKLLFFLFLVFYVSISLSQERNNRMTFIIVIDNDLVDGSEIIDHKFLLKDSTGNIKDEINFDYQIGKLIMPQSDYDKLFKIKSGYKLYAKFIDRRFDPDSDYTYEISIPTKFINEEYPTGFINTGYFILKIYNAFNAESRAKYYFKKDENYIYQLIIPGMATLIPKLRK